MHQADERFTSFFVGELLEEQSIPEKFQAKMKDGFDAYQACCKQIVNGNHKKQAKMLQIRKFLSVPWLVCPDALIGGL